MTERITAADYRKQQQPSTGADKGRVRGTKRVTVGEIDFDSQREANRFGELRHLERAGIIENLRLQVPFELQGKDGPILTPTGRVMIYKADFVYFDKRINAEVVEDSKGHPTDTFIMKKAILAAQGVEVVET
ncbi:DUF1064 domain-containing protein [Sulfitobacter sp. R18_1]|uniref:DUF1064 domain-containing protein n=1 Tax=Sulfitobacter sp. R18_1 TaxID=2821104 RepID=UPI001AD9A49F|nr:DUF1064 domain-containing protein [Sulfitobacter sp. R18_1]MBO9430595.1 DUF1064 domain-containing protein [Sulfitobacter sp. R18_1]